MITRNLAMKILMAGLFLTAIVITVIPVFANSLCVQCTDVCVLNSIEGGCTVYWARPGYWKSVSCPAGQHNGTKCTTPAQNGCYTSYTVCETGWCDGTDCIEASGCVNYTYGNLDAATTYNGATNCG
ncbi:MAG: hypothetical protein HY706_01930 [Candidatus Hydrogenedentes bacterium]|nr:hypothetical protein [Candidatus Hydrogenedentota bacterium]